MLGSFEFANASIIGRDHVIDAKNNQDGRQVYAADDLFVGVVCDGCGSQPHSEVGATLGANWLVSATVRAMRNFPLLQDASAYDVAAIVLPSVWENDVRQPVLQQLRSAAESMRLDEKSSFSALIERHYLFTAVVAIVTPAITQVVAIGDGVAFVNGEQTKMGPFPKNAPPYLAYGLTNEQGSSDERFWFKPIASLPTAELQSFLIGTDGVDYLIAAAEKNFPYAQQPVGPISQVWTEDRFFKNKDMARRHLARCNPSPSVLKNLPGNATTTDQGLLKDDTTIVAGRRKKAEAPA